MKSVRLAWPVAGLIVAALAQRAPAADGRGEINQACALVGCFPGDDPGFPVTLTASGSYVLTGRLQVTDPDLDGILAQGATAGRVRIDLNGFEVAGPVVCSGAASTLTCAPAGSGYGVLTAGAYSSVANGTVRGFGAGGVFMGTGSHIRSVTAQGNGGFGLSVGPQSIVSHSIARQNAGKGIDASGTGAVVESCTAADNGEQGIFSLAPGLVVTRSTAFRNGGDGIGTSYATVVRGNTAYLNDQAGIAVDQGSVVVDNASFDNAGVGIYAAADGSLLGRNSVRANGFGLFLSLVSTYRESNLTSNYNGSVFGGRNMGDNACDGAPCP